MIPSSKTLMRQASLFAGLLLLGTVAAAQASLYSYQDLSGLACAAQRDSLKKAWVCPALFTEKATQKKYKDLWDGRTAFLTGAIDNQQFVVEKEIQAYLNGIVRELANGNPKLIPSQPLLLIDRSAAVNAYAIGGNVVGVNLGLLHFAQSREELALVLAHELSHNILNHPDRSMREQAEWFTSDAYTESLNEVLASKYERYTRLKKVMETYSISNSRHHRYHESDADSLAIVLLKNSRIPFDARFFLRLDSTDRLYQQPLQKPVGDYFTAYGLPFEAAWTQKRSRGLSTRNYNFADSSRLEDSLKTHPDCGVRYAATRKHSTPDLHLTSIPQTLKDKAARMIVWNQFDKGNFTAALYRILQEKDKGNGDEWYDFMLYNVMSGLHHADKTLRRFNAIGIVPKEDVSKSYYELQTALEQMPKETLAQYHKSLHGQPFWRKMSDDAKALQGLMASVIAYADTEGADLKKSAQAFTAAHKASMYCEFADHFTRN